MSWIHLIALGAGLGIYAGGSLLFRTFTRKRKAAVPRLVSEQEETPQVRRVLRHGPDGKTISAPSTADHPELSENLDEHTVETPPPMTSVVMPERAKEALLEASPDEEGEPEREASEEPQEQTEADASGEAPADSPEISETPPSPAEHGRKKHWFLVKSSSGQIRVCQAWEPTPKTIAGPFLTREEATRAKETDKDT